MPVTSRPLVSIIIITLNTPRMTGACLRSVVRNSSVPYELIVVNNSRAAPVRRLLRRFPQARVIQNPDNFGFSRAANQGIVASRGDYICLLNTDTLVPPQWLERLLDAARQPGVGAVGPASDELYRGLNGKPWPLPFRPDNEKKTAQADRALRRRGGPPKPVPFLYGFCLLLPRSSSPAWGSSMRAISSAWKMWITASGSAFTDIASCGSIPFSSTTGRAPPPARNGGCA